MDKDNECKTRNLVKPSAYKYAEDEKCKDKDSD
jgi:hypothetical protein